MSSESATVSKTKVELAKRYKVIMFKDETPKEFVQDLLEELFSHDNESAEKVVAEIHQNGRGIAGVFSKEIAEEKTHEATELASYAGHSLTVVTEVE
jgi:ATP-dependent Clp protease adaptor protein ClpS